MYRKRPIDNPGSVIATDFDDRLDRPIDPVAITAKQQQFNDDLKQERLAQALREQIAIRKCTNEKCPADQCLCNFSEQFHPQYTPQSGDLGFNLQGSTTSEISDKHMSTKETNPAEQGFPLIASPKPRSPIRVDELEFNALINTGKTFPIPSETSERIGPERKHAEPELRRDRFRHSEIFELSSEPLAQSNTIGKHPSSTRPPSPSRSPSKPKRPITSLDKPIRPSPPITTSRSKLHKAKFTLSVPSSPISQWSASERNFSFRSNAPSPSIGTPAKPVISPTSESELEYVTDHSVKSIDSTDTIVPAYPSAPPPNQLQLQEQRRENPMDINSRSPSRMDTEPLPIPLPLEASLLNMSTPNPELDRTQVPMIPLTRSHKRTFPQMEERFLYPEKYEIGEGNHTLASTAFKGRKRQDIDFAKDSIPEAMQRISEVLDTQSFKQSLSAIDNGDKEGLAINALPKGEENFLEYIPIPENPKSQEDFQKVFINTAKAVNTLLTYHNMTHKRLEFGLSQNIVQGVLQGLLSQDALSIHKGIELMYDNFAIMTRSVDSTDDGVCLNSDYIEAVFKRQKDSMEQQKTCLDSIGNSITEFKNSWNNNFPRMAELEEAVLDVQRLISKLVKGKQPEQPETQQIPSFASLHPRTTIQHTCNAQASPEIMDGIKTMTNTINSMASQMATMQSTISKMEKQLSGKNIQTITPPMTQQAPQPPQQPAHTFVPRTPTPRVQTPRPQTPSPPTLVQGPPPVNNGKKPDNRRKGKAELYTDQFGNACNADLSVGANWFIRAVQTAPDIQIHYWCNVINAGNWGYLNEKGFPSRCLPDLEISCKRNFILLSIMRAFDSQNGCHRFLIPPNNRIDTTDTHEMCNFYTWTFFSGIGENPLIRRGRISPAYYPGWTPEHVKILLDQRSKNGQPQQKPKTVSFAQAVSQNQPTQNQPQSQTNTFSQPMGAQPFFTPTPLPPAPISNGAEFDNNSVYFEDVYGCQGHSSLDAPSELNPPQRIPSPLLLHY